MWPFHTKASDHRAQVTEKKHFVVLSKQEGKFDHTVEKISEN